MNWKEPLVNGISAIRVRDTDARIICRDGSECKKVKAVVLENKKNLVGSDNVRIVSGVSYKDFILRFTCSVFAEDFAEKLRTVMTSVSEAEPESKPNDSALLEETKDPSFEELLSEDPDRLSTVSGKIGGASLSEMDLENDTEIVPSEIPSSMSPEDAKMSETENKPEAKKKTGKIILMAIALLVIVLIYKKVKK